MGRESKFVGLTFTSLEQVRTLRKQIINMTNESVEQLVKGSKGIELLGEIKFKKSGVDPLTKQATNFIEQINQTFTYLVSLKALEYLLNNYPDRIFKVNFGVQIISFADLY